LMKMKMRMLVERCGEVEEYTVRMEEWGVG
jgi:hypothetical protein